MDLKGVIKGYSKQCSKKLLLPAEIINMIIQYLAFEFLSPHSYLLMIEANPKHTSQIMQLLNLSTYDINKTVNINYVSRFAKIKQWRSVNPGQCVMNKIKLPIHIKAKFKKSANYSNQFNDKELLSDNWSCIVNVGGGTDGDDQFLWKKKTNESHLTVFHPNDVNNAYNFELPLFPEKQVNPSVIYNQNNEILYAMNGKSNNWDAINGKTIYSLDFNSCTSNKKWKWNILCNNLKCMRFDTSLCLIDNNIFIMGGSRGTYSLDYVELFNINSMQSIWLKNMNKKRRNAFNFYHDKLHQIFVGSDNNLEYYDINKDKWVMIQSLTNFNYSNNYTAMNNAGNIWKSEYDPNVIFISGRINAGNNRIGIATEMLDLRKTNSRWKLISLYDIDANLFHHKHYGNVHHLVL